MDVQEVDAAEVSLLRLRRRGKQANAVSGLAMFAKLDSQERPIDMVVAI